MPAARVVERLEVVEDGKLGLATAGEAAAGLLVEQLAFDGGKDTFGEGAVVAIGDAAHAREGAVPAQVSLEPVKALPPLSLWWMTPGT